MVMPVADALEKAVAPEPVIVYVPDPVIDLVAVPVLANVSLCRLYTEHANVPCVKVKAPLIVSAWANVAVPVLLTPNAAIVFALVVIVPVPTIVAVNAVYVPLLDNVRPFRFSAVVPGLNEVVPKFSVLNQLAVVSVAILAPVVNVKFGALDVVPPAVLPQVNVLVTLIAATVNPPVPVEVKPVTVAILNTSVPAVVCDNAIDPVPKAIARVLVLLELNIPVVRVNPAKASVPAVNVVVPVTLILSAALRVVVPA